ncbi:MAG: hypothetical protein L6W00_25975 [Lentisphaeria bacterium]|nr:MAG: hypothetical protein L6W00_25975 [Lentisphaeria bacterium]
MCASKNDEAAVEQVCRALGIAHRYLDEYPAFEAEILRPAAEEYAAGRTPNPCCRCNPGIKFGKLIEFARSIGAERIITGHYAKLSRRPDGVCELRRGDDRRKDQSYFLYRLGQRELAMAEFPVGAMEKEAVRAVAARYGFVTSDKPDSQDACFQVPGECFSETLRKLCHLPARPGSFPLSRQDRRPSLRNPPVHHRPAQGAERRARRPRLRCGDRSGFGGHHAGDQPGGAPLRQFRPPRPPLAVGACARG